MIFSRKAKQGPLDNHIAAVKTKPKSYCNGEQAKEILVTFVLPVKAAEEPEDQCRVLIGLDFSSVRDFL